MSSSPLPNGLFVRTDQEQRLKKSDELIQIQQVNSVLILLSASCFPCDDDRIIGSDRPHGEESHLSARKLTANVCRAKSTNNRESIPIGSINQLLIFCIGDSMMIAQGPRPLDRWFHTLRWVSSPTRPVLTAWLLFKTV
jgi:hypothetical protein